MDDGGDRFARLVDEDVAGLHRAVPADPLPGMPVVRRRPGPVARSAFDVDRLLAGSASFAAGALASMPGSLVVQRSVDLDHLVAWCTSSVLVDGEPVPQWGDLSGVYGTADGRHLQVHCNFPHHADGVVSHLGVPHDRAALAAAIAERDGVGLERELIDRGMVAALVRTLDEWNAHPHAAATAGLPVVTVDRLGEAPAVGGGGVGSTRILDCSRVLAGPVAGHLLASAGCDVLRLGAAHLPTVDVGVLSTGFGKRAADADLRTAAGRAAMDELVAGADVWLDAYRPGAMAGLGLDPRRAAALRPGIVIVQISAFDAEVDVDPDAGSPWAGRRGFDSIVQSTTGIRWAGGVYAAGADGAPLDPADAPRPRGLPVQALDHATGFLAAGVAARLLAHQREAGGSWLARLSLLRTRDRLVALRPPAVYEPGAPTVPDRWWSSVDAPVGRVSAVAPFAGRWTGPPPPPGSSAPVW